MINMKNKFWVVFGILAFSFVLPQTVFALSVDMAQSLAELIFNLFLGPFILILKLELQILPKIAAYNGFINEPGVVAGWTILRDLANMFFIIVLLIIAFATILRVRSYGFKQLLSNFIIVVILVNFSRTIIGLVIDLFQVVMLTFVSAIKDVLAGNIVVALGLQNLVSFSQNGAGSITNGDFLAAVFFGGIMLIVACVVIAIFIFTLAMRVITIWLLVVSAPMAFLAYVVPRTQSYFNRWVDKLLNAILVGPVIAFLLWLSFTIVGKGDIYQRFAGPDDAGQTSEQSQSGFAAGTTTENVFTYVIGISMLFGSLLAAKNLGTVGAGIGTMAAGKLKGVASTFAQRQGIGTAVRTGALVSRGLINKEGEMRTWAKPLAVIPGVAVWSGAAQRGAQKVQGMRAAQVKKYGEADLKNVLPQHREAYLKSQASKGRVFGIPGTKIFGQAYSTAFSGGANFDRDIQLAQAKVDRNSIDYNNPNEVKQAADALRKVGDESRLQKLQGKSIHAFENDDELKRFIRDKGVSVIGGMNTQGITAAQMKVIMDQDAKAVGTMVAGMDKTNKDTFMKELDTHMASLGPATDIGVKDSVVQKARILQARFDGDNDHLHDALDAMPAALDNFVDALVRVATGQELGKLQDNRTTRGTGVSTYNLVNKAQEKATQSQAEAILGEAKNDDQRERLVRNQVRGGNVKGMMSNPRTLGSVQDADVLAYFGSKIPPGAPATGGIRDKLAKANLEFAHLAFTTLADFDNFVKTIVKVEDVLKIDPVQLKRIVTTSAATPGSILTPAMLEALKKHGVE